MSHFCACVYSYNSVAGSLFPRLGFLTNQCLLRFDIHPATFWHSARTNQIAAHHFTGFLMHSNSLVTTCCLPTLSSYGTILVSRSTTLRQHVVPYCVINKSPQHTSFGERKRRIGGSVDIKYR